MEIKISPEDPVVEDDEVDVELHCNLLDGNPEDLHSVFWYKDGQLFRYKNPSLEIGTSLCPG